MSLPTIFPASIYLFKFSNGNTRILCDICINLTIKTPGWAESVKKPSHTKTDRKHFI